MRSPRGARKLLVKSTLRAFDLACLEFYSPPPLPGIPDQADGITTKDSPATVTATVNGLPGSAGILGINAQDTTCFFQNISSFV